MKYSEHATTVTCEGRTLVGVLTAPADGGARGVLIVVGGPQYRAGSHRQFVLLARRLAHDGIPAMRFDCRGMGDSEGEPRHFDAIDEDIAAALDAFMQAHSGLREVVLWALCDAVPACARVAHHDARVRGLVLLNPWVQSAAGEAKTYLRHYYLKRLLERALWRKVLHGELNVGRSARSLAQHCRDAMGGLGARDAGRSATRVSDADRSLLAPAERIADDLARFDGRTLLILSGNDLTASQFVDAARASERWRRLLETPRITQYTLAEATHTFPRADWRARVEGWTSDWVRSW